MKLFKRKDMQISVNKTDEDVTLKFYLLDGLTVTCLLEPEMAKEIAAALERCADSIIMLQAKEGA